ncbi:MAG: YkgJ family cysteine cluster protein [Patescibacteria group bacterium]|nr:YkgJ family cysteine cluster protein [Patescibacteria group bacterium]
MPRGRDKRAFYDMEGSCGALTNDLCSIYENRPLSCRQFEPGSLECLRVRKENGLGDLKI